MSDWKNNSATCPSRARLETAFENHRHELTRYVSARLGTGDMAPDLVQETFLKASTLPDLAKIQNLRAFLFRIATNLAIDHLRSASRQRRIFSGQPAEELAESIPATDPPEKNLIDEERVRRLTEALDALPPNTRSMFILFKLKGWKQKQIADHHGVSISTVEKKIKQAIMHCRNRLSD